MTFRSDPPPYAAGDCAAAICGTNNARQPSAMSSAVVSPLPPTARSCPFAAVYEPRVSVAGQLERAVALRDQAVVRQLVDRRVDDVLLHALARDHVRHLADAHARALADHGEDRVAVGAARTA